MVVIARSLPLIIRVMTSVQAQANAETIGNNAAGWNALEPGRRMTSTPIRIPNSTPCQPGETQTSGTNALRIKTPEIDD